MWDRVSASGSVLGATARFVSRKLRDAYEVEVG
jgi:hypothetical protein